MSKPIKELLNSLEVIKKDAEYIVYNMNRGYDERRILEKAENIRRIIKDITHLSDEEKKDNLITQIYNRLNYD